MQLTVVLPEMRHVVGKDDALPFLERWLDTATDTCRIHCSIEEWLCAQFGVVRQNDWPIAPLRWQAAGMTADSDYWLCADPLHIDMGVNDARLVPLNETISQDETASLLTTLNEHFAENRFRFFATAPDRWYFQSPEPLHLLTTPLYQAQMTSSSLPAGRSGPTVRRWLTEIQMLLADHEVNTQRIARGAATVNGIWLWGGGVAPVVDQSAFDTVLSADKLTTRLCELTRARCMDVDPTPQLMAGLESTKHMLIDWRESVSVTSEHRWPTLDREWLPILARFATPPSRLVLASGHSVVVATIGRMSRWSMRRWFNRRSLGHWHHMLYREQ